MGCIFRSIGCLVVLAAVVVGALLYRDRLPWLGRHDRATAASSTVVWEPLTPAGATRAREAIQKLSARSGPVFTNVHPGDLAAYVFEELSKQLPPSAQNPAASISGDRLDVRANIKLSDFGGPKALGPFGNMLGDRESVQFGGTLDVVRPGLAQYHVTSLKLRELSIPPKLIPRLLRNIERGSRPDGLADDALPLTIPAYIGDVRVANGRVTLYKATQ